MADIEIGAHLNLDASDGAKTLKNLKADIKEAKGDLIAMTKEFGAMSPEAAKAAAKVAELNEHVKDASQLVQAFNPDTKFLAFGSAIRTVTAGFAGLQGAMGLIGVESEDLQKQLLKVQSAMALSEGIAGVQEGIKSIKNLGSVLIQSLGRSGLIGLAIAGVAALTASFLGWFDSENKITEANKALTGSIKDFSKGAEGAIENVNKVKVAFDLAKDGVISKKDALKTYNDTLGDSLGKTDSLAVAEKNLLDKADAYIEITGLKAQANALFAIAAQKSAEALVANIKTEGGYLDVVGAKGLKAVDETKKIKDKLTSDAADIEKLGTDLLKRAETIAGKTGINTGGVSVDKVKAEQELKIKTDYEGEYNAIVLDNAQRRANELKAIQDAADAQAILDRKAMDDEIAGLDTTATDLTKIQSGLRIQQSEYETQEKLALAEAEYQGKKAALEATGSALGALADLVGKQTAAGKVLAIAQATINTFVGATEVLRAKSVLPEPFGTIVKIANVAAIIASGLSAIKNIAKTPVPGGSGGGSVPSLSSVSAPLAPQRPGNQTTQLDQQSLNAIGNATTRSFVLESDVTNNQERVRRLNRAARI
jgi:hypothetical protein